MALQDRNETLFYRLLLDHLEELAPIVYTPTVGDACQRFSHIVRRPRGLWITPDDIGCIPELMRNAGRPGIRLIVATDNERILGLGDQGAGGMGIPVGKLALYSAGAGINPALALPVSLDVGTDNPGLLSDPLYLGYPQPRLRGTAYDDFIEAFVEAARCFNDDIQGTAAVVVAGILAALRRSGEPMSSQRLVFVGAGAAGIGIARLVGAVMRAEGAAEEQIRRAVVMLDSRGLVFEGRDRLDDDKSPFALPGPELDRFGFEPAARYELETVVRQVAPTILIGTSGTAGAFTEGAIREMAARTPVPVVFPLSNPTANSEATPADVLRWSQGRALVATGSPFDPVQAGQDTRLIGQANNVFIFPGVGLAAIAAQVREVTDRMFLIAATTLAGLVSAERLEQGALYPQIADLRQISRTIAVAVAREARDSGVALLPPREDVETVVDAAMWEPSYQDLGSLSEHSGYRAARP